MTGQRNVKGGLVMLALGIAGGLAMSLYAFQPMVPVPASLAHYDDLPRRLFRLAHIAAVMLPLINIVLGGWLDRLALSGRLKRACSGLLLLGGVALPLTLAIEGLFPPIIPLHVSALPAVAFFAGVALSAIGASRMKSPQEVVHDGRREGLRNRTAALQEGPRA